MPYYDDRIVPAHGDSEAKVLLINEAPGPCEAYYQIPSVGDQGGNIYRALQRADIGWLSCFGARLTSPASRERTRLSENELQDINERLLSNFAAGWYMGHTRRWSLDTEGTSRVLRDVARNAEWPAN